MFCGYDRPLTLPPPPPFPFLHLCSFSTRINRACLGKYTMMTRGKRCSPATATPSIAGKKPKAGVSKSPGHSHSKAQVPAINRTTGTHPSALARQPVIPTISAVPAPAPRSTSSTATNSATANLLPELTSAISAALRSAGLLSTEDTAFDPTAAVQGSVAAVVQDITGDQIQVHRHGHDIRTNTCVSSSLTRELASITKTLLEASISKGSASVYKRPWKLITDWCV